MDSLESLSGVRSQAAFARASERIPGGVNSPVRAWSRLGGKPAFMSEGRGARITDIDGKTYIDYVLSWGPLLHGHAHPQVVAAVQEAAAKGLSFGAPTEAESELAEFLCAAVPSMDQVRLVNSGTEATMSALRLARAASGRDLIVKCDGCYHGHADFLLVAAGSGAATFGEPDSAGVPAAIASSTIIAPYNNIADLAKIFDNHKGKIAAFIIEPIAGNMGMVLPQEGYLHAVRRLCDEHGIILIFDEVMTGFRAGWGGYQNVCSVKPDMTCLGKVIGGGMPLAAYGGTKEIMQQLAPLGPCYQAGTLSGNPVAVAAGLANLKLAQEENFYAQQGAALAAMLEQIAERAKVHGVALQLSQMGTMWGYFLSDQPVYDFPSAAASNMAQWEVFARNLLSNGINIAPSPFEAAFWSSAHSAEDVDVTLGAIEKALLAVANLG
ncbi:MAG: glutamate-1-semialdehyde 2,1-aminomutase [Planctomycetes bacterium]|nr:glutamate-1-semialdehyde 2,1-aminomutase [Planctomycetota bacterium]